MRQHSDDGYPYKSINTNELSKTKQKIGLSQRPFCEIILIGRKKIYCDRPTVPYWPSFLMRVAQ